MKGIYRLALVFFAVTLIPAVSFGVSVIAPDSGSDVVLSNRPTTLEELRLQYHTDQPGKPDGSVSLGIAGDYHYETNEYGLRIYDYKLRRIFSVQPGGAFVNDSLYAEVWYRQAELKNRVMLGGMLKGAGVNSPAAPATTDPFWVETSLGMISPDLPRRELKGTEDKSGMRWTLDDEQVAAVRYDKDPFPTGVKPGLRRFWRTVIQVHPDIADALAASGRVPAELWFKRVLEPGKESVTVHWTLTSKRWERAASYPLAAHLTAAPSYSTGAFPAIFATLSKDVADKGAPPQSDIYAARAEDALGRQAGLEALVWLIEMDLAGGVPQSQCAPGDPRIYCLLAVRAGPAARADPRTAVAFARKAPDEVDRAQFATLPNAYLLRLQWATRPPGKGVDRQEGEQDLLAALKSSPIANFSKDTGDFYAMQWQPFAAWQAWDFGRLMAGHRAGDLLGSIDTLEAALVEQESVFF